jgi:hypothetical protein
MLHSECQQYPVGSRSTCGGQNMFNMLIAKAMLLLKTFSHKLALRLPLYRPFGLRESFLHVVITIAALSINVNTEPP